MGFTYTLWNETWFPCANHVSSVWSHHPSSLGGCELNVWCFSVHQHIIHCSNTHTCWLDDYCVIHMLIFTELTADRSGGASRTKSPPSHLSTDTMGEVLQHRPGPQLHLLYNLVNFGPLYSEWRKTWLAVFCVCSYSCQSTRWRPSTPSSSLLMKNKLQIKESFGHWS